MRRTTAAAEAQADSPTAVIDRLTPVHDAEAPTATPGHDEDDHELPAYTDWTADTSPSLPPVTAPTPIGPDTSTILTGRHRRPAVATGRTTGAHAVVSRDLATGRRSTVRRLAPLGVGAAVACVAALAFTVMTPAAPGGADLNSQLAAPATLAPASPTSGGLAPTTSAALPTPAPGTLPPVAVAKPKPVVPKPVAKPAAPKPAAGGSTGNGVQAAAKLGWQLVASDEFNGSGLSGNWGPYEGAGHGGNGRRVASAISVSGGIMTMSGDANGNTGGMSWNDNQTYGKWEVRARMPRGDDNYHPVLLLWPADGWPPEVDFAETTSASNGENFYLHYSSSNQQVSASHDMDITQWHNYAVEWVAGRVTGYIDGVKWFESTDGQTIPNQPMHLAIQLDNFGGGNMQPTQMQVDYVRIYK
jgi:Glycosyl hydrolases family 16